MGNKPKGNEVATTPTFIVPENILGNTISNEQCTALAWRIMSELGGEAGSVHEVHTQQIYGEGGHKHALIVFIRIPDGMRKSSPLLGALVRKVDVVIDGIIEDMFLSTGKKQSKKTAGKTRASSPARR